MNWCHEFCEGAMNGWIRRSGRSLESWCWKIMRVLVGCWLSVLSVTICLILERDPVIWGMDEKGSSKLLEDCCTLLTSDMPSPLPSVDEPPSALPPVTWESSPLWEVDGSDSNAKPTLIPPPWSHTQRCWNRQMSFNQPTRRNTHLLAKSWDSSCVLR